MNRSKLSTVLAGRDILKKGGLELPKGDLRLPDSRIVRRVLDYDVRKIPQMDDLTRAAILDSRGWRHEPSGFIVSATIDNTAKFGPLIHVSMSYPDHDPSWQEIKWVRELFYNTETDVMMVLPREELYVNFHQHCFHLWQTPSDWDMM